MEKRKMREITIEFGKKDSLYENAQNVEMLIMMLIGIIFRFIGCIALSYLCYIFLKLIFKKLGV